MGLSFRTCCLILWVPFKAVATVVLFVVGGLKYRKYNYSLSKTLKLMMYQTFSAMTPQDAMVLIAYSNSTLLNRIIKFRYPHVIKSMPHFGESFDARSLWLVKQDTREPDDPVVIYLHGGSYMYQTGADQIESVMATYQLLSGTIQTHTSILFLDYHLGTQGYPMPNQLYECHNTYNQLLKSGFKNISFLGDSAGGNLAVCYTQYLKLLELQKKLVHSVYPKSLALLSPWVKIVPEPDQYCPGRSYYDNRNYDLDSYTNYMHPDYLPKLFHGLDYRKLHFSPGNIPYHSNDWSDIPTFKEKSSSVLVVCGEDEVARDDVLEFAHYALGCPFYVKNKYGDSKNVYNESIHKWESSALVNSCHSEVHVEPWGLHVGFAFFENHALAKIESLIKHGKLISLMDFDEQEYFSLNKVVKFLNRAL